VVSVIGGGNRVTRRKPLAYCKSLNNADHLDITEILLKVVLNTVTTTLYLLFQYVKRGGRDHMVVEFITTYVISAYH
jgi:hypothetical protein